MLKKNQKTKGAEEVKESTETTIEEVRQSYDEAMKTMKIARKEKATEVEEKKKLYRRSVIKTTICGILLPFMLINEIPEMRYRKRDYLLAKNSLDILDRLMETCRRLMNMADTAETLEQTFKHCVK